MSLAEELLKRFEALTDDRKRQVIDFVDFLQTREQREVSKLMDKIIDENKVALEELSR